MEPSQVWVKERGFQKCRCQSSLQQEVAPIWQPHLHVQQTNKYFRYAQYHIKVDLETIIALATITFVVEKYLYELHPTDEKVFNDLINDK
jgi:hypothetical protein